ncbi:MAG: flagellar motor switch protein FliM [Alphaproteobacteria bacterium]|nr:flagellar motor switch protein FliM [Alphaproteobacteria bacterium]
MADLKGLDIGEEATAIDDSDIGGDPKAALNADEINALMKDPNDASGDDKDHNGSWALFSAETVSGEHLPMLEVVFDRLVRLSSTTLRNFTQSNIEITLQPMESKRFKEYMDRIPSGSIVNIFKAEEWDNYGLLTVDSDLVYTMIDVLLGGRHGNSPQKVEGRAYTTIECNLIERIANLVLSDMSAAFDPVAPVTFKFDRLETNPRFAMISREGNVVVVAKFKVAIEGKSGIMELLLPYVMLEPVRDLLSQQFMGEKFGRDSIWENHLAEALWFSKTGIHVVLEERMMSMKDVLSWKVGTTLVLNSTPDTEVEVHCGDVPLFYGRMGRKQENIAVKIEGKIKRQKL